MKEEAYDRIVIFGASQGGKRALRHLKRNFIVMGFLDNDPNKVGETISGYEVYEPSMLFSLKPKYVCVASLYHAEIIEQLILIGVPRLCIKRMENRYIF